MTTVEIWGARAGQTQSRLFEEIRQCREAGQRVLLLVPEQYTLQAERELVEQLHLPGCWIWMYCRRAGWGGVSERALAIRPKPRWTKADDGWHWRRRFP